jgi:integrase/recombinase XerD
MHAAELIIVPDNTRPLPAIAPIADLDEAVRIWLTSEVANGDPRDDTVKGYQQDIGAWMTWCRVNHVNPGAPTRQNVEAHRTEMIAAGLMPATIGRRLTVIRRFYQSAKDRGMIALNPAAGVKPPTDRRVADRKKTLTPGQAERLLEILPPTDTLKGKRDRVIIGLMLLEGLRRVELHRANDDDIEEGLLGQRILVHGKIRDRHKYPRADTLAALQEYIDARGPVEMETIQLHRKECQVTPMITRISKADRPGGRISRIGLNHIIDGYLVKAGIKKDQLSCHALRHTFATLLYKETKDLKAVQDELGHANISTSAIYADSGHEVERYSERVPLHFNKD